MTVIDNTTPAIRRVIKAHIVLADKFDGPDRQGKLTNDEFGAFFELDQAVIDLERYLCARTGEPLTLSNG